MKLIKKKKRIITKLATPFLCVFCVGSGTLNSEIVIDPYDFMTLTEFKNSNLTKLSISSNTEFSMKNYFQHLSKNSPSNTSGSCGYVSFTQYLSYLDTFVNDDIINDSYEITSEGDSQNSVLSVSPGVLKNSLGTTNESVYSKVSSAKSYDYQALLIYKMNTLNGTFNSDSIKSSISMNSYSTLINQLNLSVSLDYSFIEVEYTNDSVNNHKTQTNINRFDTYVKDLLDDGIPVVLHIGGDKIYDDDLGAYTYESYHSVVAYYYDNDGIHANFGWGSGSTDVIVTSGSYNIVKAGYFSFSNVVHSHSNNYKIGNLEYCGCGYHSHVYSDYEWLSTVKHKAICDCGYYIQTGHFLESVNSTVCTLCGGTASSGFVTSSINNASACSDFSESILLENGNVILSSSDLELLKLGKIDVETFYQSLVEKYYE